MREFRGEDVLEGLTTLFAAHRGFTFGGGDYAEQALALRSGQVGNVRMTEFHSRFDVASRPEAPSEPVYFQFIEKGSITFIRQNGDLLGSAKAGELLTVAIPLGERLRVIADDRRIGVGVSHMKLLETVHRHFGVLAPRNLTFRPTTSTQDGGVLGEARAVINSFLSSDAHSCPATIEARKLYENAIAVSLLLGVPSNVSDLIRRTDDAIAPAQLRRAQEFMRHGVHEVIGIDDIARAAGCTPRNLQLTFRRVIGTSPMRYLRQLRMEDARRRIQSTDESATAIAMSLGFNNLGRFSKDYRTLFGELPSRTRRMRLSAPPEAQAIAGEGDRAWMPA